MELHLLLGTAPLRLATYDIVLTTYGLMSSEWQATCEGSEVRLCGHHNAPSASYVTASSELAWRVRPCCSCALECGQEISMQYIQYTGGKV